jgi:hypothetical protein
MPADAVGRRTYGDHFASHAPLRTPTKILPAATEATMPASATAPTTLTPTALAPTALAPTALAHGPGLVNDQRPAKEIPAVQRGDGLFRCCVVVDLRKAKSARLTGNAISKKRQRVGLYTHLGK